MSIIKNKHFYYLFFLILAVVVICFTNYKPGTWLTGWDNLHPEFDFPMNINRSIFAVWQEYQGLGLLGGMGHAADLPRQLLLSIFSIIIPVSLLRYFYQYLMLIVGVLGIYKLVIFFLSDRLKDSSVRKIALLCSLFYLLNLGTIQNFFFPFEPFSTFWGFFPWELWGLFNYLNKPNKKAFIWFVFINILAIPQAYVETIFLVYLLFISIIFLIYFFTNKSFLTFKKIFVISGTIFLINSFWILPNAYFIFTSVSVTQNAMNNKMNNDRFVEMNLKRGHPGDLIYLEGFNLDTLDDTQTPGKPVYMMQVWRDYYSLLPIRIEGIIFFILTLLGILKGRRKSKYIAGMSILSVVVLLSDTPIISTINFLLRQIPLINQVIRNPFTKFIVPTAVIYAVLFGFGLSFIFEHFEKKRERAIKVIFLLLTLMVLIYGLPAFTGHLFSDRLRIKIPDYYFQVFNYFKTKDPNARIMNLPQDTYWGWGSYKWGLTGSGFLWYGIGQPVMDRAFDVWSNYLEQYYWELIYDLRMRDQNLFNKTVKKYDITYVLYDESYIPSDYNSLKWIIQQKELLDNNPLFTKVADFGTVSIYKINDNSGSGSMSLLNSVPQTIKYENFSNTDDLFNSVGNYYEENNKPEPDYVYPFESLFTNRFQNEVKFSVSDTANDISFTKEIPKGNYNLNIPSLINDEKILPFAIYAKIEGGSLILSFQLKSPEVHVDNVVVNNNPISKQFAIPIPVQFSGNYYLLSINNRDFLSIVNPSDNYEYIGDAYLINSLIGNSVSLYSGSNPAIQDLEPKKFNAAVDCNSGKSTKSSLTEVSGNILKIFAQGSSTCVPYSSPLINLPTRGLDRISFVYKSKYDEFPKFCFRNLSSGNCINQSNNNKISFSTNYLRYNEYFEDKGGINNINTFSFILEPGYDKSLSGEKNISYQNIEVFSYPFIDSFDFDTTSLSHNSVTEFKFNINKSSLIEVNVPKISGSYEWSNLINDNQYKRNPQEYNPVEGDFYMSEHIYPDNDKSLLLYSKNYLLNYLFEQNNLPSDVGYLLSMSTKLVNGFPLTLKTTTVKNDTTYVYTLMSKSTSFDTSRYILPPIYQFDDGIRVQFTDSSFNQIPSVNEIKDISLDPIPYKYLTKISLTSSTSEKNNENKIVLPFTKDNISDYSVKINSNTVERNTILAFSQSYDSGWKAYSINEEQISNSNLLTELFPFWFGTELKDHVMVNNWENGWKLEQPTNNKQLINIIVVYLPQYLEYVGFILLVIGILSVIFYPGDKQLDGKRAESQEQSRNNPEMSDTKLL
ncbi:hypothetical protein M1271_03540 [Patescibacteria group bacterium]|nr:hypothetical protein [Patescibacteria group bacterium]MCL5797833.1 hypothetical protein [Patescibacteria group bacterium]